MARVTFTPNIQRHVACRPADTSGGSLRAVLDAVFADNRGARGYVLDDQGALRRHMVIFINGKQIRDRNGLTDIVPEDGEVYVMQALSGG